MPVNVSYPGVYVEDLPSKQRIITPSPTSITAFIGRALMGPVDVSSTIFNFGDFQRIYGGLAFDYPLSYAVRDFFANGGSQAVIGRLFEPVPESGDGFSLLKFAPKSDSHDSEYPLLLLKAAGPGLWGNRLKAQIDMTGITAASAKIFSEYGLTQEDLFNLTLSLEDAKGKTIKSERYLNLTVKTTGISASFPNRIDRVLANESMLARIESLSASPPQNGALTRGVGGDDGTYLTPKTYLGDQATKTGLYLLEHASIFNLLCIPPDRRIFPGVPNAEQDMDGMVRSEAARYCADRRAFYIVDPLAEWSELAEKGQVQNIAPTQLGINGQNKNGIEIERNAAVFFPRLWQEDILMDVKPALFAPCGAIAGVIAASDVSRGVWKAPAGTDAGLADIMKLEAKLTDAQNGLLNPLGVNCLRTFPVMGSVIWGSRTLRGADVMQDDYKYIPVRRLALFVEDSVIRGTEWAVFEPNDETLWASLRFCVETFLAGLSRKGAFYNFKVACDATTTTPTDVAQGIVNIMIQVAPVKPAEYLVIHISQSLASNAS
ncbi:MAG: phage tail sheath C-terminal domain-containing protein [Hellea sp.]